MDRTAHCHRCTTKTGYQPYISLGFKTATRPQYCPRCHKQCPIADLDYADTLCMNNAALTRQQALDAINHVNTINAHAKSTRSYRYVEDYLSKDLGLARLPSLRTLTTPLSVSCRDCGGSYVFYRNAPDIQRTPPLYCVWCASAKTTVLPFSTDDASLIVLAQVYNLPVPLVQTLYELWSTNASSHTTFRSFVESPKIAKVISRYLDAGSPTIPTTPRAPSPEPYIPTIEPTPAYLTAPATPDDKPIPMYSTCGICGCEQPNVVLPGGRTCRNLAAYCEPCSLRTRRLSINR